MKFAFMETNKKHFEINIMARVFNVTTEAFWMWKGRGLSQRKQEDAVLLEEIKIIHAKSDRAYGSPRIKDELHDVQGKRVSRTRVNRLMREAGLRTKFKRKFVITTKSNHTHGVAENVLNREFKAEKPNQKWVTDITYLPTSEGWLYLAVVLDLFSRMIVGWAFSSSLETKLLLDALEMARRKRKPSADGSLLHHSDRGAQYASLEYQQALSVMKATRSMSRKGNCWDNAVMESFFSTLKFELDLNKSVGTRDFTRGKVFSWMEGWYNRERRHSSLGYCSPAKFEKKFYSDL
jgi:transposase InsO family protein